jgi:type VI secretion system secreted protein Hcp
MGSILLRRSRPIVLVLVAVLGISVGYMFGSHSRSVWPGGQALGTARLAALLQPAKAAAGDPIFMKVSGVLGESRAARHVDWIELDTWSWAVTRKAGKAAFSTVNVTFAVNRALPPLLAGLARGKLLTSVTLQAVRSGSMGEQDIVTITLSGVTVTHAVDASFGESPVDSLQMAFRRIDYKYIYQQPTGKVQSYDFCWDIAANRGC